MKNQEDKCMFLNPASTDIMELCRLTPLPIRLQPKSFKEFYGHKSAIAKNTYLRQLLDDDNVLNVILWGPPGCGKTSLTNIIVEICKKNSATYTYFSTSAVNFDINEVYTKRKHLNKHQQLVLFVDQIHWLDKKQQNQLLVLINNHNLLLVGTTTENPSFNLSESFLNVCHVTVMQKLNISEIIEILENATRVLNVDVIDDENTLTNMFRNKTKQSIKKSTITWLAENCDGDARIALNNFELILQQQSETGIVRTQMKKHLMYDRDSEEHHNIISAMHESIKGYNDNAALYWATRMFLGGEDLQFIARRLVRAASEDTGNKDITALRLTVSAMQACSVLEKSESEVILAQCAIYLARAPTSKEAHTGLTLAKRTISKYKNAQPAVPAFLRNIADNRVSKNFMPVGLENVKFV